MKHFTTRNGACTAGSRAIWLASGLAVTATLLCLVQSQASSRPHSSGPKPHSSASTHGGKPASARPIRPVKPQPHTVGKGTTGLTGKGLGGYGVNPGGGFGAPGHSGSLGGGMGGGFAGNGFGSKGAGGFAGMGGGLGGYGARGSFAGSGGQFGHYGNLGGQFGHYGNLGGQFGLQGSNQFPPSVWGGWPGVKPPPPLYGIGGGSNWLSGEQGFPLLPPGSFGTPGLGVFGVPPYGIFGAPPSVNFGQFGGPSQQTPSLLDLIRQVTSHPTWSGNPYEIPGPSSPSMGRSERSATTKTAANPLPSGGNSATWNGWGGTASKNESGRSQIGAAGSPLSRSASEKSGASANSKSAADSKRQADAKTGKDPKPPGNSSGTGANDGYPNSGGSNGLGGGQTGGHGKPGTGGQGGGTNRYGTPEPPAKYKTDKERNLWYQTFQKSWNDGKGGISIDGAKQDADFAVDQMLAADAAAAERQAQLQKQTGNFKPEFSPNGRPLGASPDGGTGPTPPPPPNKTPKPYDNRQGSNNNDPGEQDSSDPWYWPTTILGPYHKKIIN